MASLVVCRLLVLACAIFVLASASAPNGLQLNLYNNTAIAGTPLKVVTVPSLVFALPAVISSAEVLGTLELETGYSYGFYCTFDYATFAFLWIDDHLVCQIGAYMYPNITLAPAVPSLGWGQDNPIFIRNKTSGASQAALPVRLQIFKMDNEGPEINVRVLMQRVGSGLPPAPIDLSSFFPVVDQLETTRRQLQSGLSQGWGQWMYYNILEFTLLPSSLRFRTEICHLPSNVCLNQTMISRCTQDVEHPVLRMGIHAPDKSYLQYYIMWMDVNISVSYIVSGSSMDNIQLLFEAVNCSGSICNDYIVRVVGNYAWGRVGQVEAATSSHLHYNPYGLPSVDLYVINGNVPRELSARAKTLPPSDGPYMLVPLSQGPIGLSTLPGITINSIQALLARTRAAEEARIRAWGNLAEQKEAIQTVIMWNWVWTPTEMGPILPPSRDWSWVVPNPVTNDWTYIMFDWDNYFGSYLAGIDPLMKNSRASAGFVPNWAAGGAKTVDHAEPVIGAKVLLELYNKYKDLWIVDLLFNDLYEWNNFIWNNRRLSIGITWGAQLCDSLDCIGSARGESGMDQSPMWDCPGADDDGNGGNCSVLFDPAQHTLLLAETGATSMYILDCYALAKLALIVNRPDIATELLRRAAIITPMLEGLWDDEFSTFSNLLTNGSFYRRISPTSFYPLMVLPTTDVLSSRAERMMKAWLTNSSRFCIDVSGKWPGNSNNNETCWWGLPSISFDDRSFYRPASYIYWRGFIWAPTALFSYWGLQNFDTVPSVRTARLALVNQMQTMYLELWRTKHHCCENYSTYKNTTECTGGQFYHWGALAILLPFLEQGAY